MTTEQSERIAQAKATCELLDRMNTKEVVWTPCPATVEIPAYLRDAVARAAVHQRISRAQVVAEALDYYLSMCGEL